MRIMIINTVAQKASTGKIAYRFYNELKKRGHEVMLVYGIGDSPDRSDKNIVRVASKIETSIHYRYAYYSGKNGCFSITSNQKIRKILNQFKPDIIQLYNLHGYYLNVHRLLKDLASYSAPVVYGMLDEYPYVGYCCTPFECKGFMNGCIDCRCDFRSVYPNTIVKNKANSIVKMFKEEYAAIKKMVFTAPEWPIEQARQSYLLKDADLKIVDEFVDTDLTYLPSVSNLREQHNITKDQIVFLNVAPSSSLRKGVKYFVELAKKAEKYGNKYVFVNVGDEGNFVDLPHNYIAIPFVTNQHELAEWYSVADCFICTSFSDTMPNTCLESLSCGTPIIGFDITGVPYVAAAPLGVFVEPGNVDQMLEKVLGVKKKSQSVIEQCREYALSRYSLTIYADTMLNIYLELIGQRS